MKREDRNTYILGAIALILVVVLYAFGGLGRGTPIEENGAPPDEFCGWSTNGSCSLDGDCITGGCSNQICQSSSEEPVTTTCEWKDCYDSDKYGVECKCVQGQCQWSK